MTLEERKFYHHKATGRELIEQERNKTTHGILLYDGKEITQPLPYALIQAKRKELINQGFNKNKFKIIGYYE